MKVALFLVKANKQASFLASKDGISPLYLAVEAGGKKIIASLILIDRVIIESPCTFCRIRKATWKLCDL